MCGIVGVIKKAQAVDDVALNRMVAKVAHRGPNHQDIWFEKNVGLGHARLSIQDLSSAGHQPMCSNNKRYVIVFNGEIYNYLELKKELISEFDCQFITHSDTEVLVNSIELFGVEKTLKKITGMFAFAAWDRKERMLYLARDRFGEKPLYYGEVNGDFIFSSELKPIIEEYKAYLNINRDSLATYMRYGYVPTPSSIYSEIKKLEPGTCLTLDRSFTITQKTYWSAIEVALQAKKSPVIISFDEAVNQLEARLKDVLAGQMLSDVSLGAFLSGGVDSSTVVALMQSLSNRPIKTFSIGFKEKRYDESGFAKAVAEHLGTDHTELRVTDQDALTVIPMLGRMYDEPFADSSQIPTFLVSQLAKKHVTVALSGDGGDEVFGGYNRYFLAHRLKKILGNPVINTLIRYTPEKVFDLLHYFPQKKIAGIAQKFKKVQKMAHLFQGPFSGVYDGFCTQHFTTNSLVLSANESSVVNKKNHIDILPYLSEVEWMMLIDALTYLNDDILTKVDRAAMAVSLETRVPFLDHTLFEFAWSLPEAYKVKSGNGKRVLKELLYRYVPKKLIERPKVGFAMPYAKWLRGDLFCWAQDLLSEKKLSQQGYLNVPLVKRYLDEHRSGKKNWQEILWSILMFQLWLDEYYH
jgi:asparagine synthase (glutamine-hydrolysing)